MSLISTITPLTLGLDPVAGEGTQWSIVFDGTWRPCDRVSLILVGNSVLTTYGAGDTTGIDGQFVFTFNNRLYVLGGSTAYFSALADPTVFNDPNAVGNGFITMSNYFSAPEDLVSIAHYQGKLAFFSANTIQIWQTNADPTLFSLVQVLPNIGTFAKDSVRSVGDLDALFLHETGIRSLRARETSLSAFVLDIGSPIDLIIRAKLLECTEEERVGACSVIEPETNSYWLFIKDTIYVLNYYPTAKIIAWSTFAPIDSDGVEFVATSMQAHEGLIYIRGDDDALYIYGGEDGQAYDATVAVAETPWLDNAKPATSKSSSAIDVAIEGTWAVKAGMDYFVATLSPVMNVNKSTFGYARIPYTARGTHFKLRLESQGATAARFSSILFHFQEENTR